MRKHAHFRRSERPPTLGYLYVLNCRFPAIFRFAACEYLCGLFLHLPLSEHSVFLREKMER